MRLFGSGRGGDWHGKLNDNDHMGVRGLEGIMLAVRERRRTGVVDALALALVLALTFALALEAKTSSSLFHPCPVLASILFL